MLQQPTDAVDVLKVPMELHIYDAQHAFANDRRLEVYNVEAAKQSWGHTLTFLSAHTA